MITPKTTSAAALAALQGVTAATVAPTDDWVTPAHAAELLTTLVGAVDQLPHILRQVRQLLDDADEECHLETTEHEWLANHVGPIRGELGDAVAAARTLSAAMGRAAADLRTLRFTGPDQLG